jgi:hypothetical protein
MRPKPRNSCWPSQTRRSFGILRRADGPGRSASHVTRRHVRGRTRLRDVSGVVRSVGAVLAPVPVDGPLVGGAERLGRWDVGRWRGRAVRRRGRRHGRNRCSGTSGENGWAGRRALTGRRDCRRRGARDEPAGRHRADAVARAAPGSECNRCRSGGDVPELHTVPQVNKASRSDSSDMPVLHMVGWDGFQVVRRD